MKEKRLFIVLGSMGRGGAERVVSLISDYFCKNGWRVYIGLLLFNKVDYELNESVTVVDLSGMGKSRIKRLPGWIYGVRKCVNKIQPDCILSFAARINIIVQLSCMGLSKKIVVSERNDPYMDGRSKIIDILTNMLYPKASAVIFQTKRAATYFERRNLRNCYIIGNPITVNCLSNNTRKGKIVSVGRLTEQKNHDLLMRAFCRVKTIHNVELWIYGDGELRTQLQEKADMLGISDSVHFEGNVSNIHERIADAEMFVLSSNYEGLSNALLEAMMMGIPCISTKCAGSDEYISNLENGILVDIGKENDLVNAMLFLLENPSKAKEIGIEANRRSCEYEQENILTKWKDIIE